MNIESLIEELSSLATIQRIEALNDIREKLHSISPLKNEPVDFVRWVPAAVVTANDYNPNSVAPPEMELLRRRVHAANRWQ